MSKRKSSIERSDQLTLRLRPAVKRQLYEASERHVPRASMASLAEAAILEYLSRLSEKKKELALV